MKASFKKLTLLAHHRQQQHITKMLQDLGVLHIELKADFKNDNIESIEKDINKIEKAIENIEVHDRKASENYTIDHQVEDIVQKVLDLKHRQESIVVERETTLKNKLRRIPWGDLDLNKINRLTDRGLVVKFYVSTKKEFRNYNFEKLVYEVVHTSANQVYFATISTSEISLPFESVNIPKRTLSELTGTEDQLTLESESIQQKIESLTPYLPKLKEKLKQLENTLTYLKAQGSFDGHQNGKILSLVGWFPSELEDNVIQNLNKEELSYAIEHPKRHEDIPIKFKNKGYPKLFEPITQIFELPNYYEWDPTPLIAVFYPIMFAYCLGDAGYGIIVFFAALAGWFGFLKNTRNLAFLGMILGLMTTVMGLVKSGSVFGIPTNSEDWEVFQMLGKYVLIPDDQNFIFNAFNVALMIGVVQIFLGIFVSIYNKLRYEHFTKAIWQFGKLFIITGLIWIFLADMQEIEALKRFGILRNILLIGGVLLVMFFHDMELPVTSRVASGFLPLFFIFTGILGDVLSYVRLFALGVASAVLGLVVNQIGMQIMENSWWGILIGVVFLLFGHTLNLCIAVLGSFVHPLRLTFVEFYNNAQFKGGGKAYKPFRKQHLET